ncbi:MAG: rRNA maturation RNase YbeY [Bacillota bacterium]|jgi:probable rRNA maturation factor
MILIQNEQCQVACGDELLQFCERVLRDAIAALELPSEVEVSVVLVDDEAIRQLNQRYRQIDAPTDVLSFSQMEGEELVDAGETVLLGDIVINLPRAVEQAESYQHSVERELAFLLVHGLLHLVGYDHDEQFEGEMREKQTAVLRAIGIER